MRRVIVTVKHHKKAHSWDLEVPADVESKRLASFISKALQWSNDAASQPIAYRIMADPPGRVLSPTETLAQAGAWDGAYLVFQHPGRKVSGGRNRADGPPDKGQGPVMGWRSLGIDLPDEAEPETEEWSPDQTGFVWKKLD